MSSCIEQASWIPFSLPLCRPWRFGRQLLQERNGWLIRLDDQAGHTGWGEATPFVAIGTETPDEARAWIEQAVAGLPGKHPNAALDGLPVASESPPAARCGLETALLDLLARRSSLPLAGLLRAEAATSVSVNANLGALADIDPAAIEPCIAAGYRCIKLKVAVASVASELAKLHQIAPLLPKGVQWRLDANQAWSETQASAFLAGLGNLPVSLLEDPLADPNSEALKRLHRINPIPLGLDQSVSHENSDWILESCGVQALVLKPMTLGGLLPCLDIARRARQAKRDVIVTTSLDGAIASHATAHLAAAIDSRGAQAHGLATSSWFKTDLGPAPMIEQAQIKIKPAAGLGCIPYLDH